MNELDDIVIITEVDRGPAFANPIFQRKYRQDVPDFEHHVIAFYRKASDLFVPLSYLHFWLRDDVCLVGGGCTDGQAFRHVTDTDRARIRAANGLLLQTLRFGFAKYADRCEAFFGLCGDPRAWEIDMIAGFVPTEHEHLIVHWHRDLPAPRRAELIARVRTFGPF